MPPPASQQRRTRDKVFPFITLLVAALWAFGAQSVAKHVKSMNSVRVIGMLMSPGPDQQQNAQPFSPGKSLFQRPPPIGSPQAERQARQRTESLRKQQEQIAYVEATVFVWERIMYALAGFLTLVGLFSLRGQLVRLLHLLAAASLLLSPAITITALYLLVDPSRGAMPPLSPWTYIIITATQSAYGFILLVAYTRKPR